MWLSGRTCAKCGHFPVFNPKYFQEKNLSQKIIIDKMDIKH